MSEFEPGKVCILPPSEFEPGKVCILPPSPPLQIYVVRKSGESDFMRAVNDLLIDGWQLRGKTKVLTQAVDDYMHYRQEAVYIQVLTRRSL